MGVTGQNESCFDPRAVAHQLDLLHPVATVLSSELLGRDPCAFEDAWVDDEFSCGGGPHRVEIGYRLRRRLHRGLTRTLSPRAEDDAVLSRTKTDHGGGRDREREHGGQGGLAAFVG
jgi:hypothetical protein